MMYNKNLKLKILNNLQYNQISFARLARRYGISRQTLYRWKKLYKKHGNSGLVNKRAGPKEHPLDQKDEKLIMDLWKKKKRSAYKMRIDLKNQKKYISERQIKKVYAKYNLLKV